MRSLLLTALMATTAMAQYPGPEQMPPPGAPPQQQQYQQPGPPQQYGGEQYRQRPTICCKRVWNPYAYSQWHWDPCCCCWVICWYGAWQWDCKRPCQSQSTPCGWQQGYGETF